MGWGTCRWWEEAGSSGLWASGRGLRAAMEVVNLDCGRLVPSGPCPAPVRGLWLLGSHGGVWKPVYCGAAGRLEL